MRIAIIAAAVAILIAPPSAQADHAAAGARGFVQAFYRWYQPLWRSGRSDVLLAAVRRRPAVGPTRYRRGTQAAGPTLGNLRVFARNDL